MQSDMHYYGTYAMARCAGLNQDIATVIATAAQFVDDNHEAQDIEFPDASYCHVHPTAYEYNQAGNVLPREQRNVWVPFHFIPGNEGEGFTERLVCRKDSPVARQMVANHVAQTDKTFFFELIGIMAHVYADTFAHYGFSGVSSRYNRVNNNSFQFQGLNGHIRRYIEQKHQSFLAKFNPLMRNIKSHLAQDLSGTLGHGAVVTLPDRPYLRWKFDYETHDGDNWRDNVATYLEYCAKIYAIFHKLATNASYRDETQLRPWDTLTDEVATLLQFQGTQAERIQNWCQATTSGALFLAPEPIPPYQDWSQQFQDLKDLPRTQALQSHIYHFYQAAAYHRWYVLRDLLPQYGLMVI